MPRIDFSHLKELSTNGQYVSFAIFQAKPTQNSERAREELLAQLILDARGLGLRVESAAIVYDENGQIKTWGHEFALDYLSKRGIPRATHYLNY